STITWKILLSMRPFIISDVLFWWPWSGRNVRLGDDALRAAQVRSQHLGDIDRAVLSLVRLQQRDHEARQRQPAAVQRVHELRSRVAVGAEADVGPSRLEVTEVGARRDLEPLAAARRPQLDVVLLGGNEAEVA